MQEIVMVRIASILATNGFACPAMLAMSTVPGASIVTGISVNA
jgi:hypothetical protein